MDYPNFLKKRRSNPVSRLAQTLCMAAKLCKIEKMMNFAGRNTLPGSPQKGQTEG
jgi:hypothetical protein